MMVVRVYTDASGETHFEDLELPFTLFDYAPPAPPFDVSPFALATHYGFLRIPAGWYGDWHPVPGRQIQIILTGEIEAQVSDGAARRVGPGTVVLVEDTTGKGHVSRVVGAEEVVIAVVRLPEQPPCPGREPA
jgi:hypothetical protein